MLTKIMQYFIKIVLMNELFDFVAKGGLRIGKPLFA
jgi:hypothetical protein